MRTDSSWRKALATTLLQIGLLLALLTACHQAVANEAIISPLPNLAAIPAPTHTVPPAPTVNQTISPTPTWAVIVPATVTPIVTLAPDRYVMMAQALEPLPTFGPVGKVPIPLQRVEVQTQSVVSFALDGEEVTLWSYLIRPFYDETLDHRIRGYLGLALFTAQNELLWRSAWEEIDYTSVLTTELTPVTFSATEKGLLYQWQVTFEGSGAATIEYTNLYHWTGTAFTTIWQGITGESGASGYGHHRSAGSLVTLRNIDSHQWPEILLQRSTAIVDFNHQFENLSREYNVTLPGKLAWAWDGQTYGLRYFVNAGQITPIHAVWPVRFAPRLTKALMIDGKREDWSQIEYIDRGALSVEQNTPSYITQFHHEVTAAWDDQQLYLFTSARLTDTLRFAIDTDLAHDFADSALSDDDFVWELTFTQDRMGNGLPVTKALYQTARLPTQIAVATLPYDGQIYEIEIAIPLAALGLGDKPLVPAAGWVSGRASPDPGHTTRLYYPASGVMLGLAVAVVDDTTQSGYQFDQPITWPALIFMADR